MISLAGALHLEILSQYAIIYAKLNQLTKDMTRHNTHERF